VISGFFCLRIFYTDYERKSVGLSILSKEMFVFAIFGFGIGMFFMGL
jgi:hypothetical protein